MNVTDQIKESKAKIAKLEFEKELLVRFQAMENNNQDSARGEPRSISPDSIVPHIQSAFEAKGKAMKVAQLVKVIQQQGFHFEGKTAPQRLVLSALTRRKDLFVRIGRGMYDLKSRMPKQGTLIQQ